jgi:hypothetical protein
MMGFNLDDYVDVATRLKELLEKYPEASVEASTPRLITVNDANFVEVTVTITVDGRTARASAWEPIPGKTPYTKDSEMMNAETSALGRACGMWGIGLKKSVASLDEVRARREASKTAHPSNQPQNNQNQPGNDKPQLAGAATDKQLGAIRSMHAKLGKTIPVGMSAWTKQQASEHIDFLNGELEKQSATIADL